MENAQLKSEYVAATDKIQKLQNEIHRIEAEKKDNLNKIQNMHAEMKDLRRTLEEFESNKATEIQNLEVSLTKSLSANKAVTDKFGDLRFTVSNFMSELQFYGRESILLVVREKLLRGLSGL